MGEVSAADHTLRFFMLINTDLQTGLNRSESAFGEGRSVKMRAAAAREMDPSLP